MTPQALFLPAQQLLRKSPKLHAPRADVDGLAQKSAKPFLLLRRLRLLPLLKPARRRSSSALGIPATLPHVGATSGFQASGGDTLDCVLKAAQTADTGATVWRRRIIRFCSPKQNQLARRFPAAPVRFVRLGGGSGCRRVFRLTVGSCYRTRRGGDRGSRSARGRLWMGAPRCRTGAAGRFSQRPDMCPARRVQA